MIEKKKLDVSKLTPTALSEYYRLGVDKMDLTTYIRSISRPDDNWWGLGAMRTLIRQIILQLDLTVKISSKYNLHNDVGEYYENGRLVKVINPESSWDTNNVVIYTYDFDEELCYKTVGDEVSSSPIDDFYLDTDDLAIREYDDLGYLEFQIIPEISRIQLNCDGTLISYHNTVKYDKNSNIYVIKQENSELIIMPTRWYKLNENPDAIFNRTIGIRDDKLISNVEAIKGIEAKTKERTEEYEILTKRQIKELCAASDEILRLNTR